MAGHDRMRKKHFRSHGAHNGTNRIALLGTIAVDGAFGTGGFIFSKRATGQTFFGIVKQGLTILAKAILRIMVFLAIGPNHCLNHVGFFFQYTGLQTFGMRDRIKFLL